MTDYTIPMIIGMTLAFALGAGFGGLWGLSRHEWLYCRVTAHLTWRMREAMKSLGIEEWQIDKAQEYIGSVVIPPHIPMPEPPVKAASEREQCQTCLSIAECEQARPQVKPGRDAIIYFMKETDRLNEVRTANATPTAHVAFDLRRLDGKQVGEQHFQVPAGHADKLIEALTGIYAAEVGDLKRRLANLESYNEKEL